MISSIITLNSKLKRPSFEYWSWTAFKLGTLRTLCIIMHPNILNLWIRNICDFNLFSECIAWEIEVCGLGISPCWMVTFSKHYHYFLLVVKNKVPFICFLVISVFNTWWLKTSKTSCLTTATFKIALPCLACCVLLCLFFSISLI